MPWCPMTESVMTREQHSAAGMYQGTMGSLTSFWSFRMWSFSSCRTTSSAMLVSTISWLAAMVLGLTSITHLQHTHRQQALCCRDQPCTRQGKARQVKARQGKATLLLI